jgi:hypothetical protein
MFVITVVESAKFTFSYKLDSTRPNLIKKIRRQALSSEQITDLGTFINALKYYKIRPWTGQYQSGQRRGSTKQGDNFINILLSTFSYELVLRSFSLVTVWLCNVLAQKYRRKSCS